MTFSVAGLHGGLQAAVIQIYSSSLSNYSFEQIGNDGQVQDGLVILRVRAVESELLE